MQTWYAIDDMQTEKVWYNLCVACWKFLKCLSGLGDMCRNYMVAQHYDLCPVDSCVNLLSALDSRNGVMSMRTSLHLRALLINNNPCGQQFSWSRFTAVFDAYTGTYNDLCHTICYFRKLQAPRSALVCGATCGMHVFAGFVDKIFGHFRPEIGYGARQSGSRNLYKMLPIYSSSIWQKLSTRHV